jgi:hypothetical protein
MASRLPSRRTGRVRRRIAKLPRITRPDRRSIGVTRPPVWLQPCRTVEGLLLLAFVTPSSSLLLLNHKMLQLSFSHFCGLRSPHLRRIQNSAMWSLGLALQGRPAIFTSDNTGTFTLGRCFRLTFQHFFPEVTRTSRTVPTRYFMACLVKPALSNSILWLLRSRTWRSTPIPRIEFEQTR